MPKLPKFCAKSGELQPRPHESLALAATGAQQALVRRRRPHHITPDAPALAKNGAPLQRTVSELKAADLSRLNHAIKSDDEDAFAQMLAAVAADGPADEAGTGRRS